MRIVDFSPFPDQQAHREALVEAFGTVDLDGASATDPVDPSAAVGLGLADELDDDAVRSRAELVRDHLAAQLGSDFAVRFQLADAPASHGGAPDHTE